MHADNVPKIWLRCTSTEITCQYQWMGPKGKNSPNRCLTDLHHGHMGLNHQKRKTPMQVEVMITLIMHDFIANALNCLIHFYPCGTMQSEASTLLSSTISEMKWCIMRSHKWGTFSKLHLTKRRPTFLHHVHSLRFACQKKPSKMAGKAKRFAGSIEFVDIAHQKKSGA